MKNKVPNLSQNGDSRKTNSDVSHADIIATELEWLETCIAHSMMEYEPDLSEIIAPELNSNISSEYINLVHLYDLNWQERLLLMLVFAPHRHPKIIQELYSENNRYALSVDSQMNVGVPTAETFIRLIAGEDLARRAEIDYLFDSQHLFYKHNILFLNTPEKIGGRHYGIIEMESDYVDLLMYNQFRIPQFSPEFPATLATSTLSMKDIHFSPKQGDKILEIRAEIDFSDKIRNQLGYGTSMSPGYMALFYGEPGTGKTLTAATIGKELDMLVFEVNVSNLISKYIGETTKNLDKLFRKAAGKNWILVFNEADCLFGKRSHANGDDDAGASHANQTISYLLDAIPRHEGIIILTTNMRHYFDKAFGRRISGEVHFKPLSCEEASNYLEKYINKDLPLEKYEHLQQVIERHTRSISIASLNNVVHRATRIALMDEDNCIKVHVLERCLKDEIYKINN